MTGNFIEFLQKLMQTHIVANNYKGKRLLEAVLIKQGVIAIVNGDNPRSVAELLGVYFGDGFAQEYKNYMKIKDRPSITPDIKHVMTDAANQIMERYGYGDGMSQEEIDELITLIMNRRSKS